MNNITLKQKETVDCLNNIRAPQKYTNVKKSIEFWENSDIMKFMKNKVKITIDGGNGGSLTPNAPYTLLSIDFVYDYYSL